MDGYVRDGHLNRLQNWYADLRTSVVSPLDVEHRCLSFFWNMYGSSVNRLEVWIEIEGSGMIFLFYQSL